MNENIKKCKFKYTFRSYQQRVLNEAKRHLVDKKLHIVAAPGAGKTILALSLMVELGEPTLIVAPTILLRQQWLDRLKNDFEGFEGIEDLISEDIYNPNYITITTYQSLYSLYKGKSEKSRNIDIVKKLKELNIKTIMLDEAHHLKLAWLDATKSVIEKLQDVTTISLTATPPYDIDKFMWNKYIGLCGDIDIEVAVPELVGTKDLAPHQDYVYFNYPSDVQTTEIASYTNKAIDFFYEYSRSSELVTAISMHEGIINLDSKLDYFIDNFEYFDAMISFLHYNGINVALSSHFNYEYKKVEFNIEKMQILLTYCLYNDKKSYASFSKLFRQIMRELNEIGAIYERKVNLAYTNEVRKVITQNVSKIGSVKTILEFEKENLKERLKAVVITENIYKELLNEPENYETKFIGVIPLFRYLSKQTSLKYIVLTGEIILIPVEYKERLMVVAKEFGIEEKDIIINDISFNFEYCRVDFNGKAEKNRVLVITKLFENTDSDVLIGSNALIGEGWDAPFINTLIMATPVSAYVSANQIRGRVIRKDKKVPNKFANIWHLVCVEKTDSGFKYGYDYENLIKRFDSFEGINFSGNKIFYGIHRLELPYNTEESIDNLEELNQKFLTYSINRDNTLEKWFEALKDYKPVKKNYASAIEIVENVAKEKLAECEKKLINVIGKKIKAINTKNDIDYVGSIILSVAWLAFVYYEYKSIFSGYSVDISITHESEYLWLITVIVFFVILPAIVLVMSTIQLARRHLSKKKQPKLTTHNRLIVRFIEATYKTLVFMNAIDAKSKLVVKQVDSAIEYYLDNTVLHDNELLRISVNESMAKVDDARYVIKINGFYFPVPTVIGKNAEYAKFYNSCLGGKGELIYLRSPEGKKELFNIKLLQNNLVGKIEKTSCKENAKNSISEDLINMEIMKNYLKKE